jgi:Cu/Ag efflux pump CusA
VCRYAGKTFGNQLTVAILILVYGSYRFANAGLDIFPEFSPKQIIIQSLKSTIT